MSFGKKSTLFMPVNPNITAVLGKMYPHTKKHLNTVYEIMTDHCHVETLLLASLLDMLNRAEMGDFDYYNNTAAMVMLSVLPVKGVTKYKTSHLELIHDVLVEIHMAGKNFRELQKYLKGHGLAYVSMHSCGGGITQDYNEDVFYDLVQEEQLLRTELDWKGSSSEAPKITILQNGVNAVKILETSDRIIRNASTAISKTTLRVAS